MRTLLSYIVVTYNRPKLLRRTLDSLAAQDTDAIEVVIVDDGSSNPEIEPMCRDWVLGRRAIYARMQVDESLRLEKTRPAVCVNTGLSIITGDIVGYLSDDQELANPRVASKVIGFFEKNPDINSGYVGAGYRYMGIDGNSSNLNGVMSALLPHREHPVIEREDIVVRIFDNYGNPLEHTFTKIDSCQFYNRHRVSVAWPTEKEYWMGCDSYAIEGIVQSSGPCQFIESSESDISVISNLNDSSLTVTKNPAESVRILSG